MLAAPRSASRRPRAEVQRSKHPRPCGRRILTDAAARRVADRARPAPEPDPGAPRPTLRFAIPSMHPRAEELIRTLHLEPHIEGGHYRRIYESRFARRLRRSSGARSPLDLHFLLAAGELLVAGTAWTRTRLVALLRRPAARAAALRPGRGRSHPPSCWARPRASPIQCSSCRLAYGAGCWAYTPAGCTVAPGYEYRGFALLDQALRWRASSTPLDAALLDLG